MTPQIVSVDDHRKVAIRSMRLLDGHIAAAQLLLVLRCSVPHAAKPCRHHFCRYWSTNLAWAHLPEECPHGRNFEFLLFNFQRFEKLLLAEGHFRASSSMFPGQNSGVSSSTCSIIALPSKRRLVQCDPFLMQCRAVPWYADGCLREWVPVKFSADDLTGSETGAGSRSVWQPGLASKFYLKHGHSIFIVSWLLYAGGRDREVAHFQSYAAWLAQTLVLFLKFYKIHLVRRKQQQSYFWHSPHSRFSFTCSDCASRFHVDCSSTCANFPRERKQAHASNYCS